MRSIHRFVHPENNVGIANLRVLSTSQLTRKLGLRMSGRRGHRRTAKAVCLGAESNNEAKIRRFRAPLATPMNHKSIVRTSARLRYVWSDPVCVTTEVPLRTSQRYLAAADSEWQRSFPGSANGCLQCSKRSCSVQRSALPVCVRPVCPRSSIHSSDDSESMLRTHSGRRESRRFS